MAKIKRIFLTGAAGSHWSTVDRYLRWGLGSRNDNSDIISSRIWNAHQGAYHDPGNDPSFDWVLKFAEYDRPEIERMMDFAFTEPVPENMDYIVRIHKSHAFALHLDQIQNLFPEADIISVVQQPYKSILWWGMVGGFDIVHNNYDYYERDIELLWNSINIQNEACEKWIEKNNLPKEYLNLDWFKKYYGEPSHIFDRYLKQCNKNPDGVDSYLATIALLKNLSNTAFVSLKQGTMKVYT